MTDQYLLDRGYKQYKPSSFDNNSIVVKFQKRFDDDFGKKYFIDVAKWSHDYVPVHQRNEWWEPSSYDYHIYISMFKEEKPIWLEFGTSWTIEEVEKFAEDFFEKMRPNYYESWEEERGARPE